MKCFSILFAALMAVALTGCINNGQGEKIGHLTKVARQGVVCPTWEAEIVRGGMNGGSGVNGQSFDFTVSSDAEAEQLRQAMVAQKEVKISYRSEAMTFCSSDSNHFLTKMEIIEPGKNDSDSKLKQLIKEIIQEVQQ